MKQKYNAFTFSTTGSGVFPVDMLRYDRCVPQTQDDIATAFHSTGPRTVNLIAYYPIGNQDRPTDRRWSSFGWEVIAGSVKQVQA